MHTVCLSAAIHNVNSQDDDGDVDGSQLQTFHLFEICQLCKLSDLKTPSVLAPKSIAQPCASRFQNRLRFVVQQNGGLQAEAFHVQFGLDTSPNCKELP